MTRLNRILATLTVAVGLFALGTHEAHAQYRSTSTSWSTSSGYSSSWSSGPNGYQSSRSGYNANSFQRSDLYNNGLGTYGRTFTNNNYRDFNVNRGYVNGQSFMNRAGNRYSNSNLTNFRSYP